jgi:hypothetical protein
MLRRHAISLLVTGIAVLAASLPAAKGDARPAAKPKPPAGRPPATREHVEAAEKAIGKAVAAIARDLRSEQFRKREDAQRMLTALTEALFDGILDNTQWDDPEQRLRLKQCLRKAAVALGRADFYASFPPAQRKMLRKLEEAGPAAFAKLFAQAEADVAKAVEQLGTGGQAGELILLWALRRPDALVRVTAAKAAAALDKPSKRVLDAVYNRLTALEAQGSPRSFMDSDDIPLGFARSRGKHDELKQLYKTPVAAEEPRVLKHLLAKLVSRNYMGMFWDQQQLAALIFQLKDPRTVVTLVKYAEADRTLVTFGDPRGAARTVLKLGDVAMGVVLLQTGQRLKDYGFAQDGGPFMPGGGEIRGFKTDADRTAARKKFKQWWNANKDKYKDVKPIPLGGSSNDRPAPFVF